MRRYIWLRQEGHGLHRGHAVLIVALQRFAIWLSIPLLGVLELCGAQPVFGANDSAFTIQDVQEAWQARQDRIRSARFTWSQDKLIGAHTMPPPRGSGSWPPSSDEFLPEKDVSLETTVEVALQENMLRYHYEGQVYHRSKGGVRDKRYQSVFDGSTAKNLHLLIGGDQSDYPRSGFIRDDPIHYDFDNINLLPILITCRPLDEQTGGVDLARYEMATEPEDIDGRVCRVLRPRASSQPAKLRERNYWVDAERDFIVLRVTLAQRGLPPTHTLDIRHEYDAEHGWLPSQWELVIIGGRPNRVFRKVSVARVDYEINKAIPVSEFQLEFPQDTAVVDNRTGERYIARQGGAKRTVTRDELSRGATYQDLISTETGDAALKHEGPTRG